MKNLLAAAALTPLLVACASADARESAFASAGDERRVLVVNGTRIELEPGGDAAAAIERALDRAGEDGVRVHMELDQSEVWDEAERAAFAEAMAALASGFAHDAMVVAFGDGERFDFDFDFDHDVTVDEAELRRHAERAERHAARHAERMERHAERMARHAERLAERAERDGRRMELMGLQAGLSGMRSGLAGIEEALERGWVYNDGERTALDAETRAELEEAREELARELEAMRVRLAEARERHGMEGEHREVRIRRHDGEVRAWVDGEEVTGSELDRLLEEEEDRLAGAPTPPPPPREPRD